MSQLCFHFFFFLQTNPEHFVFSTFGVMHVYPDQPAESMTLAEWQRDAVLWSAASKIPFFKHFLVAKAFHRYILFSYFRFSLSSLPSYYMILCCPIYPLSEFGVFPCAFYFESAF